MDFGPQDDGSESEHEDQIKEAVGGRRQKYKLKVRLKGNFGNDDSDSADDFVKSKNSKVAKGAPKLEISKNRTKGVHLTKAAPKMEI